MSIRQNRRIVFFSIWNTKIDSGLDFKILEREGFSLDFQAFGPSVHFGPRSKVVLCGEGYVWTPIWWSSCHAPIPGPTRMTNPNRVRDAIPCIGLLT